MTWIEPQYLLLIGAEHLARMVIMARFGIKDNPSSHLWSHSISLLMNNLYSRLRPAPIALCHYIEATEITLSE